MKRIATLLVAGLLLSFNSHASDIRLDDVQVKLFLEKSGELSADVTEIEGFYTWNFHPSGAGIPANERFSNFMVVVRLGAEQEVYDKVSELSVRITKDSDGAVVFEKSVTGFYVGPEGVNYQGFWISDQSCQQLIVTVSLGSESESRTLPFACGE